MGIQQAVAIRSDLAERFKDLHQGSGILLLPNAWDAGSARILATLGFEAIATTSAGMAWTLGLSDGAASREQALANARAIVDAVALPVNGDLENGYGPNAEDVVETLRLAGEIGLSGASIEDASGVAEHPIYDFVHAVERIAAAAEAVRAWRSPLLLTARAENFLHGCNDLDDTIRRLVAFEKAGADVLYAPGLPSLDAVREVCRAVTRPVNVLAGGGASPWSVSDIVAAGARRISVGSGFARAAFEALVEAAASMREGTFAAPGASFSYSQINEIMGAYGRE